LFFLTENVSIHKGNAMPSEDEHLNNMKNGFRALAWSGCYLATNFSEGDALKGQRNRTYVSNIPFSISKVDFSFDEKAKRCLQDNVDVPNVTNCRIDDNPVTVKQATYLEDGTHCRVKERSINIHEREALMGFPNLYVEKAGMCHG
jgi:hypothetical protein